MDRSFHSDRPTNMGRRLQKKRPQSQRNPSVFYPDRLRLGADRDEDVASVHGVQTHMNQSMFSLIAAAGSRKDFYSRFGEESSGSDTERELDRDIQRSMKSHQNQNKLGLGDVQEGLDTSRQEARKRKVELGSEAKTGTEVLDIAEEDRSVQRDGTDIRKSGKERRKESKLLQSLPRLMVKSNREKNYMSQSVILPAQAYGTFTSSPGPINPRDAPVMRKIIEAEIKAEREQPEADIPEQTAPYAGEVEGRASMDSRPKLMNKLQEIFGFDEPEEVISEYPCWLLQSLLLQGYFYVTAKHFCFYAYLPKKKNQVLKSGSLMKKVKRGPKYNRQWFILKGDILSYYDSPASQYFQVGHVDLRFATSASITPPANKSEESKDFTITTPNRVYYFTADTSSNAKEWVKALQKVIFRTHNDGDSVKIALPIANVIDIEEAGLIDVAKTFKVRIFESEETFAVDEYYFSFFSFGEDAMAVMQSMISDTPAQRLSDRLSPRLTEDHIQPSGTSDHHGDFGEATGLSEPVRATLSPKMLPVTARPSSGDGRDGAGQLESREARRGPSDVERERTVSSRSGGARRGSASRSPAVTARRQPRDSLSEFSPVMKASDRSESFVDSITASSGPNLSIDDFQSSGSQVLSRSDIFRPQQSRYAGSPDESGEEQDPHAVVATSRKRSESRSATPKLPEQLDRDIQSSPVDVDVSSPGLKKLIKAGQYPLQRAAGIAGMLHKGSKDMSALLATNAMGYVEKVSGMWNGGRRHYRHGEDGHRGLVDDDAVAGGQDDEQATVRFRQHFGLPDSERLLAAYFGFLHRVLPLYGKIYVSDKYFCFRSLIPGMNTKIILPLRDIETVHKENGFRLRYSGLVVVIQGFEELFFEFNQREIRDDCAVFLHRCLDASKIMSESMHSSMEEEHEKIAKAEHNALMEARQDGNNIHDLELPKVENVVNAGDMPVVQFDDPRASILNFKPKGSLRITCLTIGSRGDVQPFIALCKGFLAEGHKPRIATHAEFEPWVRKHGIDFEPVDGDPAELMRICIENGMFTVSFLREASSKFRGWIDDLLSSAWKACQDSDLLIESPSAMAGIHIAEAMKIPYFRAFTMPWTRTRAYPHAFAVPEHRMGGHYNWLTYVMFDNVFWAAISGQVNRWRKKELKLPSTTLEKLHPNKVPFLYNFSPSVVIPPIDFSDWVRVTGYWFLDEGDDYQPDEALASFIRKARADGKKLVYIGFGSIVVSDTQALTECVVGAVLKADVRCILSKGWSDRLGKDTTKEEAPLPPEILKINACPHDWLFRQVDCAVHHGGAGTTGASLRAGLPTVIKPFFGDQFFFANRVEDLQVGVYLKKLNVSMLSRTIWEACYSERMIAKAKLLGEHIRKEDGVGNAIQAIYRDMEYAKTLIKNHDLPVGEGTDIYSIGEEQELGDEESWTFVGDDANPDIQRELEFLNEYRRDQEVGHDADTSKEVFSNEGDIEKKDAKPKRRKDDAAKPEGDQLAVSHTARRSIAKKGVDTGRLGSVKKSKDTDAGGKKKPADKA